MCLKNAVNFLAAYMLKLISREVFLCAFAYVNVDLVMVKHFAFTSETFYRLS